MNIRVYTPKQFAELEQPWKQLEYGKDMTVFQLYDWYKQLNKLYFREHTKNIFRTWIYVLAEDEEKPIMIAPIQVIRLGAEFMGIGLERAFYFIGRQGYSDYLNFIYKDFSEKAVLCIFSYLQKTYGISKCYFERLLIMVP